jgi:2-oxoglutarate dehydrogenase E1 component
MRPCSLALLVATPSAWRFVDAIVWPMKNEGYDWRHVARVESGSPATGSKAIHDQELVDLMEQTFAPW